MRNGINWAAYVEMAKRVTADLLDTPGEAELVTAETLMPEIIELYENGYRRGLTTGWTTLDQYFSVRHGEFTVITGHPHSGKSSWLDNLMVNVSKRHGWKWAVFSAENYPVQRHISGLCEIDTGKPFPRGATDRMSRKELEASTAWNSRHFRFIQPKEGRYSLDRIVQIAFSLGDIDALVVDPWNELDHSRPRELREDEFISICLTKLRWLARKSEIHVFVVAHPAKGDRIPGQAKPVVTLNEVKGASEWWAKADNGISVWRDEADQTGASDIHVQKVRFREVGRAGTVVRLYYDRVTGRFSDPHQKPTIEDYMARREPGEDDE